MRIESRIGEGTSVKVYLPRPPEDQVSEASSNAVTVVRRPIKGAIILLVDDDEAVREVTATMLRTSGYVVLEVGSGGAALDLRRGDRYRSGDTRFCHARHERGGGLLPCH